MHTLASAASLLAESGGRVTYDLARFQSYTERWQYLVLGLLIAAALVFVATMYRRDSVDLRRGMGVLLATLRIAALLGVLAYYANLDAAPSDKSRSTPA